VAAAGPKEESDEQKNVSASDGPINKATLVQITKPK